MPAFWYKKSSKIGYYLLQALCVFAAAACLGALMRWGGGKNLRQLLTSEFIQTDTFCQTVEDIVRRKIGYEQNRQLFETGGVFDENRQVDIRQYAAGTIDEANRNMYTTYTIGDLLSFASGGASAMERRVAAAAKNPGGVRAGELLAQESAQLETVLPVSGTSLSDFAAMSAGPAVALPELYRMLCETSRDIADRYQQYLADQESGSEGNPLAPSNVRYFVENSSDKTRYTNMGVRSMAAARSALRGMDGMTVLFEGERRFNIMVSDNEEEAGTHAADWFMQVRFTGSGEKVLLAADLGFPVGDALAAARREHQNLRPYVLAVSALLLLALLAMAALLALQVVSTGRSGKDSQTVTGAFDKIPAEIAVGTVFILVISWQLISRALAARLSLGRRSGLLLRSALFSVTWLMVLYCVLSLVRRIRTGTLWKESVVYSVIRGTRQVYSARKRTQRLLLAFLAYFTLNVCSIRYLGRPGLLICLALNAAALLYLMRDAVGNQNVREGLRQISQGDLDYRIGTDVLTGESREMGIAVNEMGEGLKKAVEDMLRNERLKAELITNLSHDLKTPLTSIINYVDLLKRENIGSGKAREYIRILEQKSGRLRQLTEDLIEVSKISSGNVELHPERMQLQLFLRQAVGEFEERMEERELTTVLEAPSHPVFITADGRQLWRVFENLLGNIVKYAAPGTNVYLRLEEEETSARVVFENTPAVPITATAEELRERFARGDASRNTEGSGLGLSIAGSLTDLLGGTFAVEVEEHLFRAKLQFPKTP